MAHFLFFIKYITYTNDIIELNFIATIQAIIIEPADEGDKVLVSVSHRTGSDVGSMDHKNGLANSALIKFANGSSFWFEVSGFILGFL